MDNLSLKKSSGLGDGLAPFNLFSAFLELNVFDMTHPDLGCVPEEYINYIERETRIQEELENTLLSSQQSQPLSPSPPSTPSITEPIPEFGVFEDNLVYEDTNSEGDFVYSSDSNHEEDITPPVLTMGFRERFEQELENTFSPEQLTQMYNDLQSNNL